ncbi:MAG: C25 family cysteine peptidase [Fidelibacterota bacterium]
MGQISHQNYFSRSDLNITTVTAEDGNIYNMVSIADIQQMDELGKPYLPVKYVKLIVPSDQDVGKIVIKDTSKVAISGAHFIFPAQPPILTSTDYQKPDFVPPDSSVYESDAPYPSKIVKVVHDGYFDGSNHIVALALYPLRYQPNSGRLVFFSSIDFELEMKHGKMPRIQGGIRSKKNQQIYNAILEKIVDNPEDIPIYKVRPTLGKAMKIQSNPLPSYEYVIITNNVLKDKFESFVSWKKRKGLDIGIVTMEQITANYIKDEISDITDDAGALRQYLCDSYYDGNPKTMWALLAGDHKIVQVRYGDGSKNSSWEDYSHYKIPANLYFEDFNGDWDVDGDPNFGEKNTVGDDDDDPDYTPEIFVGRLPCTNEQDIANWIDKLLKST